MFQSYFNKNSVVCKVFRVLHIENIKFSFHCSLSLRMCRIMNTNMQLAVQCFLCEAVIKHYSSFHPFSIVPFIYMEKMHMQIKKKSLQSNHHNILLFQCIQNACRHKVNIVHSYEGFLSSYRWEQVFLFAYIHFCYYYYYRSMQVKCVCVKCATCNLHVESSDHLLNNEILSKSCIFISRAERVLEIDLNAVSR